MIGRPVSLDNVVLVKKLRNKKPPMPFRKIVDFFLSEKGLKTDVKTVYRWSKYNVGEIIKKST